MMEKTEMKSSIPADGYTVAIGRGEKTGSGRLGDDDRRIWYLSSFWELVKRRRGFFWRAFLATVLMLLVTGMPSAGESASATEQAAGQKADTSNVAPLAETPQSTDDGVSGNATAPNAVLVIVVDNSPGLVPCVGSAEAIRDSLRSLIDEAAARIEGLWLSFVISGGTEKPNTMSLPPAPVSQLTQKDIDHALAPIDLQAPYSPLGRAVLQGGYYLRDAPKEARRILLLLSDGAPKLDSEDALSASERNELDQLDYEGWNLKRLGAELVIAACGATTTPTATGFTERATRSLTLTSADPPRPTLYVRLLELINGQ